jgi:hypothetical protein
MAKDVEQKEKRNSKRIIPTDGFNAIVNGTRCMKVVNVSMTGIYVESFSRFLLSKNSPVSVKLGNQDFSGRVVWKDTKSGFLCGFGIAFTVPFSGQERFLQKVARN